jgi:hypothetical protein
MGVASPARGSLTTVIGDEHTLADISSPGVYTLHTNMMNMQNGDSTELRIYQAILTGDTPYVVYYQLFTDSPPSPDYYIAVSVAIANELSDSASLRFTLKQVTGTPKVFKWKVLKY